MSHRTTTLIPPRRNCVLCCSSCDSFDQTHFISKQPAVPSGQRIAFHGTMAAIIQSGEVVPLSFAADMDVSAFKLFELEPGMEEALANGEQ